MNLHELPAYEIGCAAAKASSERDHINPLENENPYEYGTEEWQAWNLGWNTTLRAEQP